MPKSNQNLPLKNRKYSEKIILWLAFGFGTGFIRFAPGTWGTLPGVAIAYFLMPHPYLHLISIVVLMVIGTYLCQRASDILGAHDHGGIVIDEIVGVLITLFFFTPTLLTLILGFIWFRIFDIIKPWPIRWIDKKIHGGLGIMLDDIIAGIFAWPLLYLSLKILVI